MDLGMLEPPRDILGGNGHPEAEIGFSDGFLGRCTNAIARILGPSCPLMVRTLALWD